MSNTNIKEHIKNILYLFMDIQIFFIGYQISQL